MTTNFFKYQPQIKQRILEVLSAAEQQFSLFEMDEAIFKHVLEVSVKGKQFRGSLLTSFYEALGKQRDLKAAVDLAVAVELYGTALLIHDDIMDRSELRRGVSSTYTFFQDLAKKKSLHDPHQFGISTAISVADMLFFLADSLVYQLEVLAQTRIKLASVCSHELTVLGLAQVEDIRMASDSSAVTKEKILAMYRGKTGRYTGRWPLELAAVLANVPAKKIPEICEVGENIGVLFQLIDDQLGMFGEAAETGKSTTSDITEGKKTLYYFYLHKHLSTSDREKVFQIVGNTQATKQQVQNIKQTIRDHKIDQLVAKDIEELKQSVAQSIPTLSISRSAQQLLNTVLEVVTNRTK